MYGVQLGSKNAVLIDPDFLQKIYFIKKLKKILTFNRKVITGIFVYKPVVLPVATAGNKSACKNILYILKIRRTLKKKLIWRKSKYKKKAFSKAFCKVKSN